MEKFSITTLILFAASLTTFAASIDGKWISEREVGDADGKTYAHTTTLTLKSENGLLTGTVVSVSAAPWMRENTGRSIEIKDGKVDGDKFSFKVTTESKQGERTAVYEGTVVDDHLKGIIKFRGIGQTWTLDAKTSRLAIPVSVEVCGSGTAEFHFCVPLSVGVYVL
jgi:hypothetical protein